MKPEKLEDLLNIEHYVILVTLEELAEKGRETNHEMASMGNVGPLNERCPFSGDNKGCCQWWLRRNVLFGVNIHVCEICVFLFI